MRFGVIGEREGLWRGRFVMFLEIFICLGVGGIEDGSRILFLVWVVVGCSI